MIKYSGGLEQGNALPQAQTLVGSRMRMERRVEVDSTDTGPHEHRVV